MELKQLFRQEIKVFFAQTLFRFEGMALSQVQTRQLLDKEKKKELHFDFDQTQIINNVIEALDFIDKVDLKTISIDSNTYIKLNEILAKNQALETGKFRDQEGYIPCIENPIPPVKAEEIEKQLNMLDHVDKNNFKIRVPIIFSELIKAQPFFDGNKRTTLFICNLALLKKDLGVFYIKNDKYPEFEEKLTDFYTGKNRAVQVFLEENCIYKKNELTPKLTNPELQENNIKKSHKQNVRL